LEEEGDDVGRRRREVALFDRPRAGKLVFVADDADELVAPIDRRVDQRSNPERLEVALGELTRDRIGARVADGDEAMLAERADVARERDRGELDHVLATIATVVLVHALDDAAALLEEPDPHAIDAEALGADLRRRTEPSLERVVRVGDRELR